MQTRHTFTSPADLLRTLNAEGYMQAQEELLQQVQTSYEVFYCTASRLEADCSSFRNSRYAACRYILAAHGYSQDQSLCWFTCGPAAMCQRRTLSRQKSIGQLLRMSCQK